MKRADESAFEYMRRVVHNCDFETCDLLDQLPTVAAVIDFYELWGEYGTEFWAGILECIAEGDSPEPAIAFIRKHKLPKAWMHDVNDADKRHHASA